MNPKYIWISIIVVILAIPCLFYGVMLVLVQVHPVAFEPNYEQKAANWDEVRRQQQRSKELGWKLHLETAATKQRYQVEVTLGLKDPHGKPITDALVEIDAFHTAHASKVIHLVMKPTEDRSYQEMLSVRHSGMWEFQLTAKRRKETFLQTLQRNVTSPTGR